jgi:Ca2+-binding EF-hand superfamily protein
MLSCLVVWRGAIGDDDTVDPQQLGAFFVLLGVHMSDKELHVAIADIDDSGDMLVEFEELIEWCARTNERHPIATIAPEISMSAPLWV